MSRVCRPITASFFFSLPPPPPPIFLFSINVVISSFIECMPVESNFPLLFRKSWVCVGVGVCVGGWVDVQALVSVCE